MERKAGSTGPLDCLENSVRKRLHVKQSIDHALNSLKGHSHSDSHMHTWADAKKQSSPGEHNSNLEEYTFYTTTSSSKPNTSELLSRQPSLSHISDDKPMPPLSNSWRPRSAGQDTKPEPPRVPGGPRKLGSKYSLPNKSRRAAETPNALYFPLSAASTPLHHLLQPLIQFLCLHHLV